MDGSPVLLLEECHQLERSQWGKSGVVIPLAAELVQIDNHTDQRVWLNEGARGNSNLTVRILPRGSPLSDEHFLGYSRLLTLDIHAENTDA